MNASLSARLPFEVFDDVGDVDTLAIDPDRLERAVEYATRRTNEGRARQVLCVARLFAHEDNFRLGVPLAEDRLRGIAPQITSATSLCRRPGRAQGWPRWNEWSRRLLLIRWSFGHVGLTTSG